MLASPRSRRRAVRLAVAVAAVGAVAALSLAVRHHGHGSAQVVSAPVEAPVEQKQVRVTAAERAAVDATLDRFVPAAMGRRDPGLAYDLSTPALRQGMTRSQWQHGQIPVFPHAPRGTAFHGWRLNYDFRGDIDLDLLLQPRAGSGGQPISYRIELKRIGGRWLVDSAIPVAVFGPHRITATPDFGPEAAVGGSGKSRLSPAWFLLPAAIVGLFLAIPVAIMTRDWRRGRRAMREYRRAS